MEAIQDAPTPQSVQELRVLFGIVDVLWEIFTQCFIHSVPPAQLLRKDFAWKWEAEEEEAFNKSKKLLTSSSFLVHFDPDLPLTLACDASAYGIGAVLAHLLPDGTERLVGYASRTLSKAERNYSQLEKEGLSCIFGIKKFNCYVFG